MRRGLRPTPSLPPPTDLSHTPIVWSACGRPHQDTLTVWRSPRKSIAHKPNFVSAEVVFQRLHSSITLEFWKPSARQIRSCWPLTALPSPLAPDPQSRPGPLPGPLLLGLRVSPVPFSPVLMDRVVSQLWACVCLQKFCTIWLSRGPCLGPSSFDCWRYSMFAGVPGGCGNAWPALLETPSGLIAAISAVERPASLSRPQSRSRSLPPKAAPNQPRGSILLSQRGPIRLSARALLVAAPAPRHLLPALSSLPARPARPALPFCPRLVPRLLTPMRAVGAHAGIRSGQCGAKFSVKLSPASPCGPAATTPRPTTAYTTPATLSCSCAPTPSSRLCCWPGSPTSITSRLPWVQVRLGRLHCRPTATSSCRPRLVEP